MSLLDSFSDIGSYFDDAGGDEFDAPTQLYNDENANDFASVSQTVQGIAGNTGSLSDNDFWNSINSGIAPVIGGGLQLYNDISQDGNNTVSANTYSGVGQPNTPQSATTQNVALQTKNNTVIILVGAAVVIALLLWSK